MSSNRNLYKLLIKQYFMSLMNWIRNRRSRTIAAGLAAFITLSQANFSSAEEPQKSGISLLNELESKVQTYKSDKSEENKSELYKTLIKYLTFLLDNIDKSINNKNYTSAENEIVLLSAGIEKAKGLQESKGDSSLDLIIKQRDDLVSRLKLEIQKSKLEGNAKLINTAPKWVKKRLIDGKLTWTDSKYNTDVAVGYARASTTRDGRDLAISDAKEILSRQYKQEFTRTVTNPDGQVVKTTYTASSSIPLAFFEFENVDTQGNVCIDVWALVGVN